MARFTRADIRYHGLGYGSTMVPAVNVKIYEDTKASHLAAFELAMGEEFDRRFTLEWVNGQPDKDRYSCWDEALREGWEQLQEDTNAEDVFGRTVEVFSEGRQGGWAYVDWPRSQRQAGTRGNLFTKDDVSTWDAVAVARWGKFVRYCRETCQDQHHRYLWRLFHDIYLPWREDEDRRLAAEAADARLSL